MLIYSYRNLIPINSTDFNFKLTRDSHKSTSWKVFTLGGGAVALRSIKQSCIVDSTIEVEYVVATEVVKEKFGFERS